MTSDAEPLLFLPGASGNRDFWRPVSERLRHAGERRLLGYPGFGGLPVDAQVTSLEDLASLVARDMTGPVSLIAQSMGGVVAALVALRKPELVRRIVLTVTSGGLDLSGLGAADWRAEFAAKNPRLPRWFSVDRTDLSARLPALSAPALLLWGDADPISPVAVGRRLAQLLPKSKLIVLAGGTHDLAHERAEEVFALIDEHLSSPTPPK